MLGGGVLSQRGFVPEGFCPRGPQGFCPRGLLSQRGFVLGGFVLGGFVLEGFCPYTVFSSNQASSE